MIKQSLALVKPEEVRMGRAALNWSLEQLAQESGLHRNTISNFETGKYAGDPLTLAALKRALESAGVIFSGEVGETPNAALRRFQVGDLVRFRARSRVPSMFSIAEDELGTVDYVEPHPPQTGPTYRIGVQFKNARVPGVFKYEFELVKAATSPPVTKATAATLTSGVSAQDVEEFCNSCVFLRSTFSHYQILFEEGGGLRYKLLEAIAPTFFGDLNEMLIEQLILQICKITDPEETKGKENLTVAFLLKNCDFPAASAELTTLKRLSDSMHGFRAKIIPARNKLIGHLDRHSVHNGKALGATDTKLLSQFWVDLQEFLHILHKRYVDPNGVFDLNRLSDADGLVKALKQSTYFEALLADKKLESKCLEVAFGSGYSQA